MKIKTQLNIFLAGVILVPFVCAVGLPVYRFINRPDRMLLSGYKQIREMACLPVSKQDLTVLKQVLRTLPPNIDFMIISNGTDLLFTNIEELKSKMSFSDISLFDYIKSTSDKYFYQLVAPPLEDKCQNIILVSRVSREEQHRRKPWWEKVIPQIMITFTIFELFCISIILLISKTIASSITILDKNTQKIAGGELDVKLEYPKNKNNEITSLTENLDKMRLALKDDAERRSKFIMGISHDLRTPVAVIKGYTEALNDGLCTDPNQAKKTLEIISNKTEQLETMINTLINFVKLNQTDWMQQLKRQRLLPVIKEFAQSAVTTGDIFKRKITSDINISSDFEVPFDKLLINRALENLFSNAVRYTNEDDEIKICATQNKNKVILTISDSGIGIEQKDIDRIFDLFYRGTNSRRESGMGIGLSVVKTIISAHNWEISVASKKGSGTVFTITISDKTQDKE